MFDRFFPDAYVASTYVIDFEKLYEEGIRAVILILTIRLFRMVHRQMTVRKHFLRDLKRLVISAA